MRMNQALGASGAILLLFGCGQIGGDARVVEISELAPEVVIGLHESGDSMAVFTRVRDAAFVGREIAVLDASPPFVRVFSETGEFVGAVVGRGQGPGEADSPAGLAAAATDLGGYLVTERSRVSRIGPAGDLLQLIRSTASRVRGAVAGCDGGVQLLTVSLTGPGAIVRVDNAAGIRDTLLVMDSMRSNTRAAHPFYALSSPRGILFYSEELHSPQLVRLSCAGQVEERIPLDSLGRPEWWENGEETGQFLLHPSQPPWPAGLAEIGEDVIWATQFTAASPVGQDSLTRVTRYKAGRAAESLVLRGWYEILDSDLAGRVLLASAEPVGHVLVVSGRDLVRAIRRAGVQTPRK